MKKFASLVLDRYDDVDGSFLKKAWSATGWPVDHLDSFTSKLGERRLTRDELDRLPDETFAVILEQDGLSLRKYSMADAGNAMLSAVYFCMLGSQMPKEAQQVAAQNLLQGLETYGTGMTPMVENILTKVALGVGTLLNGALVAPGALQAAKGNLQAVQGGGSRILTPEQIQNRRLQMGVQQ
jgi:hypothetical protein